MAKRIIYSAIAKQNKQDILKYWYNRNKSKVYPKKLNILFTEAIQGLAERNFPRKKTDYHNVFIKIVREYLIFFEEDDKTIFILTIWDSRRDPEKLQEILKS